MFDRFVSIALIVSGAFFMGSALYSESPIAFAIGSLLAVLGARELLGDSELGEGW